LVDSAYIGLEGNDLGISCQALRFTSLVIFDNSLLGNYYFHAVKIFLIPENLPRTLFLLHLLPNIIGIHLLFGFSFLIFTAILSGLNLILPLIISFLFLVGIV
jgi:hypothetical protein